MESVEQLKCIIADLLQYIELPDEPRKFKPGVPFEVKLREEADRIEKMKATVKAAKKIVQGQSKGWKAVY